MIKYEHDMLVLSPALSKYDQIAINDFVEATLEKQKSQILDKIKKLEDQSHATRTPLYQELLFSKVKNIVEDK
jgi:hypothetical protein